MSDAEQLLKLLQGAGVISEPPPADSAEEYVQPYTHSDKPPPSRWGFVGTVYFYDHGGEPQAPVQVAYNHTCALDELPWTSSRRFQATEEWQPLPVGWSEDESPGFQAGLLVVSNNAGRNTNQVIPSDEFRAEVAAAVVELGTCPENRDSMDAYPFLEITAGRQQPFTPVVGVRYYLRCRQGTAAVSVLALPC